MVHVKRNDRVRDPERVLKAIGACREEMIEAGRDVRPMGAAYHALNMVVSAIDSLATFLTGQRYYFENTGPGLMARMPPGATPKREDQ